MTTTERAELAFGLAINEFDWEILVGVVIEGITDIAEPTLALFDIIKFYQHVGGGLATLLDGMAEDADPGDLPGFDGNTPDPWGPYDLYPCYNDGWER